MTIQRRTHRYARPITLAVALVLASTSGAPHPSLASEATVGFVDVGSLLGIDVTINGPGREDWGFGTAFVDYDGDGDLDLYVATEEGAPNRLFQQQPNGRFVDVAVAAGVADTGNGRAVKWADCDNDGDQDFFLGNYRGPNRLYRNNGDGTFTDIADAAMASGFLTFGAAWGDFDADGWLDLYVVNRRLGREPGINQFFHGQGNGVFVERGAELGLDDEKAGLETAWLDYDNDGDADLYLSNDKFGGNRLWRNDGDGTFTDVSVTSRANITINSMGLALGDYDGDGYVDLYMTNTSELSSINNVLLHNNGDGTFDNLAAPAGVTAGRYGWGTAFFDHDNDGDLDLYVVNWDATAGDVAARNQLFRNEGPGDPFVEIAAQVGAADANPGYGLTLGDFDDDGYVDMFVSNNAAPSTLFRNTGGSARWLKVRTIGVESNRDGIGARVRVVAGPLDQLRDVDGGQSYLSHHSKEACFGLGSKGVVDVVEVRWPCGCVDRIEDVATNQTLIVIEGSSEVVEVTGVVAEVTASGIAVKWDVSRDKIIAGFRVYRRQLDGGEQEIVSGQELLAKSARAFVDDADLPPETRYEYVVAAVDLSGGEIRSPAVEIRTPEAGFVLEQNRPNPFNPGTTISFVMAEAGPAKVTVYDAGGRLVRTLVNEPLGRGRHDVFWTGRNTNGIFASAGVYFYRLETDSGVLTRKMVLVK